MIIDLNAKHKTLKYLENNRKKNVDDLVFGNDSLYTTPKLQSIKEKLSNLDLIKIKNLYSAKGTVKI